jgi:hypothetical protein
MLEHGWYASSFTYRQLIVRSNVGRCGENRQLVTQRRLSNFECKYVSIATLKTHSSYEQRFALFCSCDKYRYSVEDRRVLECCLVETGRRFRRLHGAASDETVVFILAVVRTEIPLTFPLSVLRHCVVKAYSGHGCRAPWIIDIGTVIYSRRLFNGYKPKHIKGTGSGKHGTHWADGLTKELIFIGTAVRNACTGSAYCLNCLWIQ